MNQTFNLIIKIKIKLVSDLKNLCSICLIYKWPINIVISSMIRCNTNKNPQKNLKMYYCQNNKFNNLIQVWWIIGILFKLNCKSNWIIIVRKDTEPLCHTLYVITCITSFPYLSIPCNAFIACYNYMLQRISTSFQCALDKIQIASTLKNKSHTILFLMRKFDLIVHNWFLYRNAY